MTYWQYIAKQRGLKFAGVVLVCFAVFYLAGFFMPEVNSWVELKYLAVIIGVPMAMFFGIHYYKWRRRW